MGGLWEHFGAVLSPKIVQDHYRDSDCKRPGLAYQPGLFLSPLWNQSQQHQEGETILLLRDMQKGAKLSLKEATPPQGLLGQNGGCHKQHFAPILLSFACKLLVWQREQESASWDTAALAKIGRVSCACTARHLLGTQQQNICPGLVWRSGTPIPLDAWPGQTLCTFWCVQHQQGTRETGQT